jgi:heme/copper-type cytochrome/quinol oxidase subunit 2
MVSRMREIMSGPASGALVLLMLAGCLFLWIGVPLGWLWIGSQVQASASLGTAMLVTMLGIMATIIVVVIGLSWLNRRHAALQERRNRPQGHGSALEVILVSSAGIALVGFGIWFFGFAGASPLPLNIGF